MAAKSEEVVIKVERKSKSGVLFNNVWFNISKYGDATLDEFEVGKSYNVIVNYGKDGGAFIDSIVSDKSLVPSMPKTAVERTPPSKVGSSPVAPAGTTCGADSLSLKDVYMAAQAAMKSALESPTVHYLATTLPEDQVPDLIRKYAKLGVDIVLEIVEDKRG